VSAKQPVGSSAPRRSDWSHRLPDLGTYGPVFALVFVFVVFGIWKTDLFLTSSNLFTLLNDNADLAVVAFGLTVVLLTGEFDLSIAGTITFTGFLSAGFIANQGVPTPLSIVIVLLMGLTIGAINGVLVVYFRIHALIATLAVSTILDGFTFYYSKGSVLFDGIPTSFTKLGSTTVGQVETPAIYMAVIGLILWGFLRYTAAGRYLHAIGGNRDAARLSGIRVGRYVIVAFMISGFCAAWAGIVEAARNASVQPTGGQSFLLPAFAAAFLGSATLRRGEFHILGTLIGVYLIASATSGFFILGAPFYTQDFIQGGLLIAATAGSRFLGIKSNSSMFRLRRARASDVSLAAPHTAERPQPADRPQPGIDASKGEGK
jgi:ribose transport system permease protein